MPLVRGPDMLGHRLLVIALMAWWMLVSLAVGPVMGQEDEGMEDILDGFADDETGFQVKLTGGEVVAEHWWDLSGSMETSGSINFRSHRSDTGTDYTDLQRLRNRLNLQLDLELPREWVMRLEGWAFYDAVYSLNGRGDYTRQVLNEYELDADMGEVWLQGSLHRAIDLKVGRQVVIWGRSETLRVLDILNPIDNREPGRVDLEDLRRPLGMLKVDGYSGEWSVSAIVIPEIRFDLNPVKGSDFFSGSVPTRREPKDFEDVELAGSVTGIFEGWDVSFHAARFWNDQPRFRRAENPSVLLHDRLWLVGSGGNYTVGSWLLKYEVAYISGIGFFNSGEKDRFDTLLGVEYYGFTDTTIILEGLNRHLLDYDPALRASPDFTREDTKEIAVRATRDFLNDSLHATALFVCFGWDSGDGSVARFDVQYELRDALEAGIGILLYQSSDLPPLDEWDRNDRLIFNIKWSF